MLDVVTRTQLERHPKVGASWEGFVIENLIHVLGLDERQCHFWATHSGAEIDLIVQRGGRLRGYEVKRTSAPAVTRSMRTAVADLGLHSLDVIHAGEETFPLTREIRAVAAVRMIEDL